jgi:putative membrane protein
MKKVSIQIIAVATAIVFAPAWACAQDTFGDGYAGHMMWWDGRGYGMVFGPLFMILVLALVIAVAVLVVRWVGGPQQGASAPSASSGRTALDILKERFARGEIDKSEFEDRRRALGD